MTIFGLSQNVTSSVVNILAWLVMSGIIIGFGIFMNVYVIAVIVPIGANLLITAIMNFVNLKQIKIHKYVITALFSFLWASHLNSTKYSSVYILSSISILLSLSTIMLQPIKQFISSSPYYKEFNIHSVRYMRFLVILPLLLAELIIDLTSNIKT